MMQLSSQAPKRFTILALTLQTVLLIAPDAIAQSVSVNIYHPGIETPRQPHSSRRQNLTQRLTESSTTRPTVPANPTQKPAYYQCDVYSHLSRQAILACQGFESRPLSPLSEITL